MEIIPDHEVIINARDLAKELFSGVELKFGDDKGKPYFDTHLSRVANLGKNTVQISAGYLHDSIEDIPKVNEQLLLNNGIPRDVVDVVKILTRREEETYFDFIIRISESCNEDAVRVKLNDLLDNSHSLKSGSLLDKYRFAYYVLSGGFPSF